MVRRTIASMVRLKPDTTCDAWVRRTIASMVRLKPDTT
jgi:hypothetical protein